MKLNGAEILLECLLEQGVDTVFGYPGGSVLNIYDALYMYKDKINHVLTAHEQGAAHAADGYARSSNKTGVVLVTSGPGATNIVTGIATAYMDSVPMVAITGNVPVSLLGLDSFQEVDITGITMPITKHNFIVKDVKDLADTVRRAFYIAGHGRKGPVLIDIPKDVTSAVYEYTKQPVKHPKKQSSTIQQTDIDLAVKMINSGKKPFIYTGGGVISSNASEHVSKFANLLDAPVASSLMGKGGFDNFDSRYVGMLGMHGTKAASLALSQCDLFIGVGTRFSDRVILKVHEFAPHAKILHIDIDPAEVNKNIRVDHKVIGDISCVLECLNNMADQKNNTNWMANIKDWKSQYHIEQVAKDSNDITPQYLLETLCDMTNDQAIITTEVGQNQMWASQYYKTKNPRTFISSGGLGTMGYGLGASIGAQVANPGKQVINIAGDGSFHMNCNELVTAARYNIPIIEIILNNGVLGMVRQWQRMFYEKRFSQTTLERDTDYVMLANAYGIEAYDISTKDQVAPTIKKALQSNKPVLINCKIDKDINVLPMVPAGESIHKPILEIDGYS